jgi:cytoskeleton protein RodZ
VTAIEAHSSGDAAVDRSAAGVMARPGARLKAAREAAGLSIDQVAQQLKLAQRQVKALEDENFAELPGRTFSRGFFRNYARLVNLDADELLEHLPDAAITPSLVAPTLHSTAAMIAELPSEGVGKRANFTRWLIPLALVACVVAAATYEWYRGGLATLAEAPRIGVRADGADARSNAGAAIALPNPLTREAPPPQEIAAGSADEKAPAVVAAAEPTPVTTVAEVQQPAASAIDAPIVLTYSGPSWTEIRDRNGQLLISRLVAANSIEPVRGAQPFDIVLGNAPAVTLTYRGKSVDLSPHTRQNVARLTLP